MAIRSTELRKIVGNRLTSAACKSPLCLWSNER